MHINTVLNSIKLISEVCAKFFFTSATLKTIAFSLSGVSLSGAMTSTRVLVAGGGLGIGQFITKYLVEKHGAKVVVLGLHVSDSVAELEAQGEIRVVRGDATKSEIRKQTMDVVSQYLGGLDSLIVTLGIIDEIEKVAHLDVSKLRNTFEINFFAPVQLVRRR